MRAISTHTGRGSETPRRGSDIGMLLDLDKLSGEDLNLARDRGYITGAVAFIEKEFERAYNFWRSINVVKPLYDPAQRGLHQLPVRRSINRN